MKRFTEAVRRGDLEQARAMLGARPELVNLDMAENDEHRALHYAVFERSAEMVRLLMQRGADARKGIYPHREATTALRLAIDRGYSEIVGIIEEEERRRRARLGGNGIATSEPDELTEAMARGDEQRALELLQKEAALVHSSNRNGWTPLHVAAAIRGERLVEWLVARGADVNSRGPGGKTPLDQAAGRPWGKSVNTERFVAVARTLLGSGAELTARAAVALGEGEWLRARHAEGTLENAIEDWGGLLTVAVVHRRREMLELLLELGFDPDERVRLGDLEEIVYSQGMPLWHCAATGQLAMAEVLLERGAHPNVHVYASGTPAYSAFRQRHSRVATRRRNYCGAPPTGAIRRLCEWL